MIDTALASALLAHVRDGGSDATLAAAGWSVAYGADGLCFETHVNPTHGIGDDPKQSLTPSALADVIRQARIIHDLRKQEPVEARS
mgnify:CR=1 FL=1